MLNELMLEVFLIIFMHSHECDEYHKNTSFGLLETKEYRLYAEEQFIYSATSQKPARKLVSTILYKDISEVMGMRMWNARITRKVPRVGHIRSPTNKV